MWHGPPCRGTVFQRTAAISGMGKLIRAAALLPTTTLTRCCTLRTARKRSVLKRRRGSLPCRRPGVSAEEQLARLTLPELRALAKVRGMPAPLFMGVHVWGYMGPFALHTLDAACSES